MPLRPPPGEDEGWEAGTPLIYACESPTVPFPAKGFRDPGAGVGPSVLFGGEVCQEREGLGVSGLVLQTPPGGGEWGSEHIQERSQGCCQFPVLFPPRSLFLHQQKGRKQKEVGLEAQAGL